ncbi:Di-and tricarboxylate transporter [Gemmobacter megaterium]|uniref:Di-and tricarboxylate transporter n=1 Tax=Gemmobacter megaterium TaxID=1086013 RepID=A0A1N7QJ74_9RHOB|nr:SLC13 family permease [Gemmobacter megaterium]GGE27341.1 sodium:sulfate symporter [Gemmobacter megaterium]SIT22923.1 Di-and tricarboxylate transporter [Gemmobacter megaterium]
MSPLAMVLALLGAAVVMFALNRPRMDVVAVIMMVALPMTGVITMSEALVGLSDPNIVLIAALFVIGEALVRTGVAQRLGDWLTARAGASEAKLIFLLMVIVAGVGSFMSSTGVVAIFIPIVLRIARNARIPAGRLMMPLSMAALISGMMTLVATAPNLVVHSELMRQGHEGFGFFAFTPFGVPILVLAILYMLVARRFLAPGPAPELPERAALTGWVADYGLAGREHRLQLRAGSDLVGQRLDALDLRASAGINIIAIERDSRFRRKLIHPRAETALEAGDILLIDRRANGASGFDLDAFAQAHDLIALPVSGRWFTDTAQEIGMAQIIVPPTSRLIGKTVTQARFRSTHDLSVIGMKHGTKPVPDSVIDEPLRPGDTLLTVGPWRAIRKLADERRDLVLLDLPAESDEAVPARHRAPLAVGVLALVVVLMVWGIVPNVQAALFGCLLLGLFRCIDMAGAYRSIHWQSLILIVGMLPFSLALQRTGGVEIAALALLGALDGASPQVVLAAIFAVTGLLGLFISNTATAVLMAPVALAVASALDASPYPFAMTVALAASAAFMTPVSSPVNTLVVGPGNYRFTDFLRIGVPFAGICLLTSVLLVPVIMPF